MTCSTCHTDAVITLHHTQRIGRRVIEWDECARCYLEAEKRAEQLRAEAIADRAVKLPDVAPRRSRPASLPFINQIEGDE